MEPNVDFNKHYIHKLHFLLLKHKHFVKNPTRKVPTLISRRVENARKEQVALTSVKDHVMTAKGKGEGSLSEVYFNHVSSTAGSRKATCKS